MKTFTLKNPKAMGENDPKYGQAFWAYTHDSDIPVMFNLMEGDPQDGDVITCEEWVNKQSAKGTDYMRLRKVRISGQAPKSLPPIAGVDFTEVFSKLDEILAILHERHDPQPPKEPPHTDEEAPEFDDEPINLDDIPF